MLERAYDSLIGVGVPDIVCKGICVLAITIPVLAILYVGAPLLPKIQSQPTASTSGSNAQEDNATYFQDRKLEAFAIAKTHVIHELKAPASADFPNADSAFVSLLRAGEYRVSAYVDAQNSFGSKVRTNYVCDLAYEDKRWILKNLTLQK